MEGPGEVTHRKRLWAVGPMAVSGAWVATLFPGATPTAVGVVMVMHVATAVAIVWVLTHAPRGPSL